MDVRKQLRKIKRHALQIGRRVKHDPGGEAYDSPPPQEMEKCGQVLVTDMPHVHDDIQSLDEYRQRAQDIMHLISKGEKVWSTDTADAIGHYLELFVRGQPLDTKSEEYVRTMLDQYENAMQYADFLVDQLGLKHAHGADDCASWDFRLSWKPAYPECKEPRSSGSSTSSSSFEEIRGVLVSDYVPLVHYLLSNVMFFNEIGPNLARPYYYLAACVHETRVSEAHSQQLLYMIDMLDKRVYLLQCRHDWFGDDESLGKDSNSGSVDSRSEFRSLLQEATLGNFDFGDMLYCRDVLAGVMNKSKTFLDELFGRSTLSRCKPPDGSCNPADCGDHRRSREYVCLSGLRGGPAGRQ